MGKVTEYYKNKELKKDVSDIFADIFHIERCEDFHIHWRNFRLIFSKEEFETFCNAVMEAYKKWEEQGKPDPEGEEPKNLYKGKINPVHDRRPKDFKIEYIEGTPYMPEMIHIHYRSLRLDLSKKELEELK